MNVVFILSDDQGYWAMGCSGNPEIRTPNLDRLAREGIRFENFFCASPVCSPARATLLTGRIPSRHGVIDWISGGGGRDGIEYLKGQTGYTDILAENGYTCGLSGKWHLGDGYKPQKGFTHWFTFEAGSSNYYDALMIRDHEQVQTSGYLTDVITDDAIGFIKDHAGRDHPFYLSVNYNAPHRPWIGNHPKEIVDSYDACEFKSCPQGKAHPWATPWGDKDRAEIRENLKGYFAAITAMDIAIGRLINTIDRLGIRESTLIVFSSDNGYNCGHHGIWGKGNGTFPQNMFDTSVKVPAIFSLPGTIPQDILSDELVSAYDFMPTLLDFLKLKKPEDEKLPGISFLPLLRGENKPGRENVVIFDEYGPVRMIRTNEMKYIHRYPYGPHELYDLKNDPDENVNLVDDPDVQDVVCRMRVDLEDWFFRYADRDLDARSFPVAGSGQCGLAGPAAGGVNVFEYDLPIAGPDLKGKDDWKRPL